MSGWEAHPCEPSVMHGLCIPTTTHRPAARASRIALVSQAASAVPFR